MSNYLILLGAGASLGERGSSYFQLNTTLVEKAPPLAANYFMSYVN